MSYVIRYYYRGELFIKINNFIDTQGLDHVDKGILPEKNIYELFSKYHNDIKNVFYIKKFINKLENENKNNINIILGINPHIIQNLINLKDKIEISFFGYTNSRIFPEIIGTLLELLK